LALGAAPSGEAVGPGEAPSGKAVRSGENAKSRAPLADADALSIDVFLELLHPDRAAAERSRQRIFADWHPSYSSMILELVRYARAGGALLADLERVSGQSFEGDLDRALRWLWRNDFGNHPEYARFKQTLYAQIDPRFAAYFDDETGRATIRLDEIRWGGIARDGIPPLDRPKMISAGEAGYLDPDDIVFGVELGGDARAYPKRILAWHEMFKDVVGGVSVNGVYCTLCGTMIVYETEHAGVHHELGTSGFLYRSNKLMYDRDTESLWSTVRGEPVVGPLVGKGIRLKPLYVVTTTWAKWQSLHSDSQVLSLDTGHLRDYGEGAAYREYFASDELMFTVPVEDRRLANKDEVLVLRFGTGATPPTAIESAYLAERPIHAGSLGRQAYVVLTDASGAHRVYAAPDVALTAYDGEAVATDERGGRWSVHEGAIVASDGRRATRLPAHRAFWFGWHAAHPDTHLIQRGATAGGA